ncbi:hypothetical protein KSP39_PZI004168 [Platanthera zijinensis]|uniref:Uncharacterized protein n=1 Tax=Platanthera zijinensis TaxID=2320716 RepID=A0AAP0GCG8_9ASPA
MKVPDMTGATVEGETSRTQVIIDTLLDGEMRKYDNMLNSMEDAASIPPKETVSLLSSTGESEEESHDSQDPFTPGHDQAIHQEHQRLVLPSESVETFDPTEIVRRPSLLLQEGLVLEFGAKLGSYLRPRHWTVILDVSDEMEQLQAQQGKKCSTSDTFNVVMLKGHTGRVRLMGKGVTKSDLKTSSSSTGTLVDGINVKVLVDLVKSITARVKDELTQEILSTVLINLQRVIPNLDSDSILAGLAAGIQSPGDAISEHGIRNARSSSYVPFDLNKFLGEEIPIIRGSALSALNGTNDEIGRQAVLKLMDVVDEYIPDPISQLEKPFLMPIEDVFSIQILQPNQHEAYQKGAQAHHNAGQPAREKDHTLAPERKAAHGKAEMEDATNEQQESRRLLAIFPLGDVSSYLLENPRAAELLMSPHRPYNSAPEIKSTEFFSSSIPPSPLLLLPAPPKTASFKWMLQSSSSWSHQEVLVQSAPHF